MPTGAITSEFVDRASAPPPMSDEAAVLAILAGARAGSYVLRPAVRKSAEGAAAVAARATAVHLELNAAAAAVDAGPALLVAEIVRASATTGALSKIDAGAEMVRLEAAVVRLRREEAVYAVAADKIASYPVTILRANAGAVAEALDSALAQLLTTAAPHAAVIAALGPGADNLRAHRADAKGFDALERLVPRLEAIETAGAALAALGTPWPGLPAPDGRPPVLYLAALTLEVD